MNHVLFSQPYYIRDFRRLDAFPSRFNKIIEYHDVIGTLRQLRFKFYLPFLQYIAGICGVIVN